MFQYNTKLNTVKNLVILGKGCVL